ncbi:alpha/beta hydrolase [Microbacterium sp. No. 7]|uniref:alpha/beta hydrolase n=1 Tax=Microbacterium sp. No. 7 TaxID=1714373 RepID=UPI0006CF5A7F|nr:alpha/beta hydrolase-fold protein [Microbacterium sp. No. 7]ALJ20840.1 hypothetical protein AOA12_13375 [Microbacterium sp. No. 7]
MVEFRDGGMFNPLAAGPYFEIDSEQVGGRFAISVSLPAAYHQTDEPLPVLYVTDGNVMGPLSGGVSFSFTLEKEAVVPCRPYVQVAIGYTAEDAAQMLSIRNRDLVPPGEPIAPSMYPYMRDHFGLPEGEMLDGAMDTFFASYADGHGDRLLEFIKKELHPVIAEEFRIDTNDVGFFGYSFGGLLALYALGEGDGFFSRIGAGSPGILVDDSVVFPRYADALGKATPTHDLHLHISVNIHEMEGPVEAYRRLAIGSLRFLNLVKAEPLPGLRVTSEMLPGNDHEAGLIDAYRSFVRSSYRL